MNVLEHRLMQNCLKGTCDAITQDKETFNSYSKGLLTIEECIDRFCNHNCVSQARKQTITNELMIDFMSSLGWRKR